MAIRGLDVPSTGLFAYGEQISVVGNNLANLNTAAFKKSDVRFQDILYELIRVPGTPEFGGTTGIGVEYGRGVTIASIPTIFKQGAFNQGLDLDVAIDGPGFFRVSDKNGNIFYTRLGAFQPKGIGASGEINLQIGGDTYTLDPAITLPGNAAPVTIAPDGELTQGVFTAQINLYSIQNPDGLLQIGDLLFRETVASGEVTEGTPGTPGFGKLIDNALEASNVDLTEELVQLLGASQGFSLNSQTFATENEEIRLAIALSQQS